MTSEEKPAETKKARGTLTGQDRASSEKLLQLLHSVGVEEALEFTITEPGVRLADGFDVVIALMGREEKVEDYLEHLAELKLIRKIPVLIAFVDTSRKDEIEKARLSSAADEILYFPMNAARLAAIIRNHALAGKGDKSRWHWRQNVKLQQALLEKTIVTPLQMQKAINHQLRSGQTSLLETLVEMHYISKKDKTRLLREKLNVMPASARQLTMADLKVVSLIPADTARQYTCIAVEKEGGELSVAMSDPLNLQVIGFLQAHTRLSIKPLHADAEDIRTAIEKFYPSLELRRGASEVIDELSGRILGNPIQENGSVAPAADIETGVIKLLNLIISNAVRDRATDIHIEPTEGASSVRYRIDGDLRTVLSPPGAMHRALINRLKEQSGLSLLESGRPQEGGFAHKYQNLDVRLRVSLIPTISGERAVISILDKETFEHSIQRLGLTERDHAFFMKYLAISYGLVIVSGPSGSGKTTTLYAAIQETATEAKNIVTVEDPVESHISGITQIQADPGSGFTVAEALHAAQKQDMDTLLISELKDRETIEIAVKTALTGHLVLAGMLADDVFGVLAKLADVGISPLLLGSSLNLIINQRLVKKICPHCKTPYTPPKELLDSLNILEGGGMRFYQGEGCVQCNGTGFLGKTGIFEILPVTKEMRKLIYKSAPAEELKKCAHNAGFKPLRQCAMELALRGETNIYQAIAANEEI